MREIKFRAWDELNKRMVYPDTHKYVLRFDGTIGEFKELPQRYHTVEWELMQYTGLKDKNGVEIYEGDIVIFWDEQWQVIYYETYSGFILQNENELAYITTQVEIIGNIHQNPELLK